MRCAHMRTWVPASILCLGFAYACGPARGTEGASCPNNNNCIRPLLCIEGTCQMGNPNRDGGMMVAPRDGGVAPPRDAGPRDAGPPDYDDAFSSGTLNVTPDGMTGGFDMVAGRVGMIREATGYTSVRIEVTGLPAGGTFAAHVHAQACADDVGGGHYKIDDTVMEVVEANEIWPNVTVDMDGLGIGYARVNHYARVDARSIVIHEPMNADKIACADLTPNANVTSSGTLYELAAGMGSGITGTAELRRAGESTTANVTIEGNVMPNSQYPVHVHAQPCADNEGGGHYKIDETIMDTDQNNEIWPVINIGPMATMGSGTATAEGHIARFNAVSIVVHSPVNADKLLCADLLW